MDGIADTYIRPMDYGGLDPNLVDYLTSPFIAASITPFQMIDKNEKMIEKVTNQNVVQGLSSLFNFIIPSNEFLAFGLIGCLLCWLFSWLFSRLRKSSRRTLQVAIMSFFFGLFLFYIEQFFSNNLSTENVIVPTEDLLYSKEKLLKTKKEFCFLEKSGELDYLKMVSFNVLVNFLT